MLLAALMLMQATPEDQAFTKALIAAMTDDVHCVSDEATRLTKQSYEAADTIARMTLANCSEARDAYKQLLLKIKSPRADTLDDHDYNRAIIAVGIQRSR